MMRSAACSFSAASREGYKFTGKERDAESGLDYFGARYYGSNMGRFVTPDPLMASAHASNPQSLNRYAYVYNNPLGWIDPYGLDADNPGYCDVSHATCGGGGDPTVYNLNGFDYSGGGAAALIFGPTGDWAAPCPGNNCQGLEYTADNIIWGWIANTDSGWQIIVHSPNGSGYGNVLAYWGEVGRWNGFLSLYAANNGRLPNGDVPVGMDIWHCKGCAATWQQSSMTANRLAVATPFVPLIAVGGAELIEVAPGVWELAQQASFTDFATGFIQGITPGSVAASSIPEGVGIITGEIVSNWSTIKQHFCSLPLIGCH